MVLSCGEEAIKNLVDYEIFSLISCRFDITAIGKSV